MIVCHCVGATDQTIARLVAEGATSLGDIVRECGAGRCCAPCRDEISCLLRSLRNVAEGDIGHSTANAA